MKFVKILNYVENSYEGSPSFVILMSDGKEYISNGCVFIEKTLDNIDFLIEEYDCESSLDELFEAPGIDISELVDGRGMFWGCSELTEFNHDLPNLTYGYGMFECCYKLTEFTSNMPYLIDGRWMFYACIELSKFTSDLPNLKNGNCMFNGCKKLIVDN